MGALLCGTLNIQTTTAGDQKNRLELDYARAAEEHRGQWPDPACVYHRILCGKTAGDVQSVFLGDETLRQFLLRGSTNCDAQAQVPTVYRVRPHDRAPEYPFEGKCMQIN